MYIALGSNIDAETNMKECAALLREAWTDIRFANVYSSAAQYEEDQDDFLNSAAYVQTEEPAEDIHDVLTSIEKALKKDIAYANGPRTIDLDLLLYDDTCVDTDTLQVPHPRMHTRKFVLAPLCELLDPQAVHPILEETWADLLKKTQDQTCDVTDINL